MRLTHTLGLLASCAALSLAACSGTPAKPQPEQTPPPEQTTAKPQQKTAVADEIPAARKAPKRIILMIGDGMGLPVITGAAYAKGQPLELLKMPYASFMRTHEHEFLTTDSAASATAFATGHKTHFEGVSVKPGTTKAQETDPTHHLEHMVAQAKSLGLRSGLVATSRINHATPAAFASHRAHRGSYEEIALDMSTSGVDVLIGGGRQYFAKRKDGLDLLSKMRDEQGYSIADTADALLTQSKTSKKLVSLLHDKDMPSISEGGRAMSLAKMTEAALQSLDLDNEQGFFLMVEGSQIDWEEHAMNGPGAIAETLDFDEAIGVATKYAQGRDDTLVIVTADHETGGLSILDEPAIERFVKVFGSFDAANKAAATTFPGAKAPVPDALSRVELAEPSSFGPREKEHASLVTSYGHLSIASRKAWTKDDSFIATHTNTMVPLFAQGVGAAQIATVQDNADLGQAIFDMLASNAKQTPLAPAPTLPDQPPKNIVLMVGDGMGLASITAAFYVNGELEMLDAPVKGFVSTHATDRVVNDSAATATALAIGHRSRYGAVGVYPKDGQLISATSALELAESYGMRTGLVTTTTLTHATPAAFYAHVSGRGDEPEIAKYLVDLPSRIKGSDGIDVALGGGQVIFSKANLDALKARGVTIETTFSDAPIPANQQLLGLYAPKQLAEAHLRLDPKQAQGQPTLASMATRALNALQPKSPEDKGFFLLIEGGQIDWRLHDQRRDKTLIDEITDFDNAVKVVKDFAKTHGDTLVIITADHDHSLSLLDNHYGFSKGQCQAAKACGGTFEPTLIPLSTQANARREGFAQTELQGTSGTPQLILQYAWIVQEAKLRAKSHLPGPHAAHFVPLMAYGPSAARFSGFTDQPEVGQRIQALIRAQHSAPSDK